VFGKQELKEKSWEKLLVKDKSEEQNNSPNFLFFFDFPKTQNNTKINLFATKLFLKLF